MMNSAVKVLIVMLILSILPSVASSAYVTIQVVGNGHVEVYEGPSLTLLANASSSSSVQTQYSTNTLHKFTPVPDSGYALNKTSCNVITNICSVPTTGFYYNSTTPDYYIFEFVSIASPTPTPEPLIIAWLTVTAVDSTHIGVSVDSVGQGEYGVSVDGNQMTTHLRFGGTSTINDLITSTPGNHNVCAYSLADMLNQIICKPIVLIEPTPTSTPIPTGTINPTPTATPTTINYNIGALINNGNLDTHACAGVNRGYFYMLGPNNPTQQKYATYVNENSCTDFSIPITDMVTSGGSGIWTLAIFDESDLSASKAMFQVNITNGVILLFTSTPTGSSVYINSTLKGTTPFNYNPGTQTSFHFKFSKSGYVDAIFDAQYTISNTVNANLVLLPTTPTPANTPGAPPAYNPYDMETGVNAFGDMSMSLLNSLSFGTKMMISAFIIIAGIAAYGMPGLLGAIIIAALIVLPIWMVVLFGIIGGAAILRNGGSANG